MTGLILAVIVSSAFIAPIHAQPIAPAFDVASVKLVTHPVARHAVSLLINHGKLNIDAAALWKSA